MNETAETTQTGRAVMALGSVRADARIVRAARPDAAHVAHLLAMRHDAEQFRAKRRAAPGDAIGAYGAAAERKAPIRPEFDGRV